MNAITKIEIGVVPAGKMATYRNDSVRSKIIAELLRSIGIVLLSISEWVETGKEEW